jgi:coenzyme F420-reducing hydrogenase beta subunit/polysaccharide pyruvyl transferase WcaK-like protein
MNVNKTRQLNLCISCEVCTAVCPVEAIEMEYKLGQFIPVIDKEKCTDCGLCLKLCPGISIDTFKLNTEASFEENLAGSYLKVYSAYSKNQNIRKNSTSGGVITQLIVKLLDDGKFNGAFILPFDTFTGSSARLQFTKDIKKVMVAAKSKYIPASVYSIVKTLAKDSDPKYIIVGTPCQIKGIKNCIKEYNVNDDNLLFLGLFCDGTLNFNIIRYFKDRYAKGNEKLTKFDFRNKEKDGWPGHPKLYFDSNRTVVAHRNERIKVKKYFQLERCLYCLDKLNRLADISFGDCYIRWRENPESSTVIVRTEKGKRFFDNYSHLFNIAQVSMEAIIKSQCVSEKKENMEFAKALVKNFSPNLDSNKEYGEIRNYELAKRRKYIEWGRSYRINRIHLSTTLSQIKTSWEIGKEVMKTGITFAGVFLSDAVARRNTERSRKRENVIIVGGELSENMGSEAMTFTVVDQVKRRFPNKKIYLFSTNAFEKAEQEKELYNFEIMPWGIGTKLNLLIPSQPIKREYVSDEWINQPEYQRKLRAIIEEADFFIDVSGYRLFYHKVDSNFPISIGSYDYLLNIMIARKFSIPYYVFPQSIGPFNYPLTEKIFLYLLMWKYLRYPEKIFPRETEGVDYLRKFTHANVELKRDIVLLNDGYKIENIFKDGIKPKKMVILPGSVGIIPNKKVMRRTDSSKIYSAYKSIIINLLQTGKKVYLIGHAQEDPSICQDIKNLFPTEDDVKLILNDLNALEMEGIIAQFDFVVTSRYHSIVHAYKNGVPALTIGWATKYFELMKDFNQLDYFFDARNGLESGKLLKSLDKLTKNYRKEGSIIKSELGGMRKNEAFEVLN